MKAEMLVQYVMLERVKNLSRPESASEKALKKSMRRARRFCYADRQTDSLRAGRTIDVNGEESKLVLLKTKLILRLEQQQQQQQAT